MKYPVQHIVKRLHPIDCSINAQWSVPNSVLLTGANGWLGRHLHEELLQRGWSVVAPIRAANKDDAHQKLLPHLANHPNTLIVPIENLLDVSSFPLVDAIVHCAADMSLAKTLDELWDVNVLTTQTLFSWAKHNGIKRFDFVSSLSVFVSSDAPNGELFEEQDLLTSTHVYGGYAASKWAAEYWLKQHHYGMEIGVHRLGLLSYSEVYGWAPNDGILAWGQSWKMWGKPQWLQTDDNCKVDWTPTTYAAQGIVEAMETNSTGVFHWANSQAVPSTVWNDIFEQLYGTTTGNWKRQGVGKRAIRALNRWSSPHIHQQFWWHDLFQSSRHTFNQKHANNLVTPVKWTEQELMKAARSIL